jgi:dipeptidyl aminopeptidase/acylaminoacyl peptidase
MAANGYIVVAPNRRGMPGHGVEWNDKLARLGRTSNGRLLSAIDDVSKESYVDNARLGWRKLWWIFRYSRNT